MGLFDFVSDGVSGGIGLVTGAVHHVENAGHTVINTVANVGHTVENAAVHEAGVIVHGATSAGSAVGSQIGTVITTAPTVLASVASEVVRIASAGVGGAEQGITNITDSNLFKWFTTPHYPSLPGNPVTPLTWDGLFSTQNIILGAAGVGVGLFVLDRVAKIV